VTSRFGAGPVTAQLGVALGGHRSALGVLRQLKIEARITVSVYAMKCVNRLFDRANHGRKQFLSLYPPPFDQSAVLLEHQDRNYSIHMRISTGDQDPILIGEYAGEQGPITQPEDRPDLVQLR